MAADHLPIFVTTRQAAAVLGYDSATAFLRQRARLELDHGLPLPLPTLRSRMRWRKDQLLHWLDCQGRPKTPAPILADGTNVVLLNLARTA